MWKPLAWLLVSPILFAAAPASNQVGLEWPVHAVDDGRGTPYKVDQADNLCGLTLPRQLTQPAKVDYQTLLEATAEHKKLKKKKIDPNSAEGIKLLAQAHDRVVKACETVRVQGGYCSVWKSIERRDGTPLPDITATVQKSL